MPITKAIEAAVDAGIDLVEVSPNANPPVCKIMDYGRFRYEQTKKQHEAKKKQSTVQIKEIKIRPKTDTHDLMIKVRAIKKFISKKHKVKVTVVFRGREIALSEKSFELLKTINKETEEVATIELEPKFEGRTIIMILSPR